MLLVDVRSPRLSAEIHTRSDPTEDLVYDGVAPAGVILGSNPVTQQQHLAARAPALRDGLALFQRLTS